MDSREELIAKYGQYLVGEVAQKLNTLELAIDAFKDRAKALISLRRKPFVSEFNSAKIKLITAIITYVYQKR